MTWLCEINKYRTSLFPLSQPFERPGGRVNEGHSRALKKSATVKKSHLRGGLLLRQRRRLLLLQLELGADRWEVARPCSVQGKFFRRKFKDRATTRGSLTRSPTLAMVGDRCLEVDILEEGSSSSAQRATLLLKEVGWGRYPCSTKWRHPMGLPRAEPKSCDRDPSEGICLARSDYGCSLGFRASSTSSSPLRW